jgi:outer membrane protein OmpA-like peptidoglycan-associated protein
VGDAAVREIRPGETLDLAATTYDVLVRAADFGEHEAVLRVPTGAPYDALVRLKVVPQDGLVAVRVRDRAGQQLEGSVIVGERPPEATRNGAVLATLPGGTWPVRVEVPGFHPLRQEVAVHGGEEVVVVAVMEPVLVELTKERIEIKESVFFETAKATIKPESYGLLDQITDLLEAHPEVLRVRIEGHTDSRGSDEANLRLSQDRAAAVRDYLLGKGIAPKRLVSVGFGETRPLDPRENEMAWSQNRRVDFWIEERAD